jgi:hypothetical protein
MSCLIYKGPPKEDVGAAPIKEFAPENPASPTRKKARGNIPNRIPKTNSKPATRAKKETSSKSQKQSQKPKSPAEEIEIHTPEQVGLTAERILKDEFPNLLITGKGDTVPEVRLLPVTFNGGNDVFTYVNVGNTPAGLPRGQRQLRRALTKREWDEAYGGREFDTDDSYAGIAVRCEGNVCVLGPRGDAVFVTVGQ